jgi:lipopolysaccharide/colanic/teichoic acid biosynthesis glycosyltransferase
MAQSPAQTQTQAQAQADRKAAAPARPPGPLSRACDLVGAATGLVVLAPLLALIALAVRRSSPGPALFRQTRVGRHGRDFVLLKFRTMTVRPDAERGRFDVGGSARVTRLGRILRATKLDELPQLWNVLRGEMALVGPRPEVRTWVEAYPDRWAFVHSVRPGITDPASIVYRDEERLLAAAPDPEQTYREQVLPHKLALYEQYVRTRSVPGDLILLIRTLLALAPRGRRPAA